MIFFSRLLSKICSLVLKCSLFLFICDFLEIDEAVKCTQSGRKPHGIKQRATNFPSISIPKSPASDSTNANVQQPEYDSAESFAVYWLHSKHHESITIFCHERSSSKWESFLQSTSSKHHPDAWTAISWPDMQRLSSFKPYWNAAIMWTVSCQQSNAESESIL